MAIASFNLSDLDGNNGFALNGINPGDFSGRVSGAGDINDDGIDDLIVGADGVNDSTGQSYVVFGSDEGFPASLELADLDGSNGFALNGINEFDLSGETVRRAGDINDDGIDDLIVGAVRANPNGIDNAGQSYVVFGSSEEFPASLELASLDGTNGFALNGINEFDFSGRVSGAGDINDDGIDDLIVGADGADPNGTESGLSYVVFGSSEEFPASLELASLDGTNGFALNGINEFDFSGYSVSGAGDINGDGIDDLIIGAYGADPNGERSGQSYVVFGSPGGFPASLELADLDGSNGFALNGINVNDQSGRSVSEAGDINNDGIDDLIVGAPFGKPNDIDETGQSYVVFGSTEGFPASLELADLNGTNGFALNGINQGDSFLFGSVSGAGDINNDGIDDLIVGAPFAKPNDIDETGQSYVVFGSSEEFPASLDLDTLDGTNGFALNGINPGDQSGRSVSGAGDINNDGIDDLIVGALGANDSAGQSYVVFGGTFEFPPPPAEPTISYTIDLRDGTIEPPPTPFISFEVEPNDSNGDTFLETVLKINLNDPNLDNPFDVAEFQVEYDGTPTDWTVNIGDSATNNGFAGDGGTQSNDAEVQILGDTLTAYSNDTIGPPEVNRLLVNLPGFASEDSTVNFEVSDQFLGWDNNSDTSGNLNSPFLYALNGQPDSEGPINYDIFAAFNRVIAGGTSPSAGRIGSGVDTVTITLRDTDFQLFDTLTVDTLVDEDDGDLSSGDVSLREAIRFINPEGTIDFDPSLASADVGFGQGTIGLTLGELVIDKSLTINGLGADELTVSGNNASRVFNVDDGTSDKIDVAIDGLTIADGNTDEGGGIRTLENLTLNKSRITDNTAFNGGGIFVVEGELELINSIASNNIATNRGGGLSNGTVSSGGGNVIVTNTKIIDNNASVGGGFYNNFTRSFRLLDSTVDGNIASLSGGIDNDGNLEITNSTISNNRADSRGGIFSFGEIVAINSTISGNTASFVGGIESGSESGRLTLIQSTVSDNVAENSGPGGIFISDGLAELSNTIVTGNSGGEGGGIWNGGDFTLTNSTIASNTASVNGGGIFNLGNLMVTNSTIRNNSANFDAGGIGNDGTLTVSDSLVSDNSAGDDAGGLVNFSNGSLTVNSSTISGNTATDVGGGIGNNGELIVSDSTVSNNRANTYGGGIQNLGGTVTITDTTISNNSTNNDGGGISNSNGEFTVKDSVVSDNSVGDDGGGLINFSTGTLIVTNSTVSGNSANDVGGGVSNSGNTTVTGSTISDNTAQIDGGGIANNSSGVLSVSSSEIKNNEANDDGGGIYNTNDGITGITGTTVRDNIAGDNGGGIANFRNGIFTVNDSTIEANEATDNGGGIYNIQNGKIEVIRSLIIDNIANTTSGTGGGLLNRGTARVIDNSIISGNSASNGGGIFNENFLELTNSFTIGNIPNDVISV